MASSSLCLHFILLASIYTVINSGFVQAQSCTPSNCQLPNCRCPGTDTPGGISPITQAPQIVYLTFNNAVREQDYPLYQRLFANRRNPNNASITATFFVTHRATEYDLVHELHRRGHEIALLSITHQPEDWDRPYWKVLNRTMWEYEIVDQKKQMAYFANIPESDIIGMRAPFLQIGGNPMYQAITDHLKYDSSRLTIKYSHVLYPGLWPYTMDYDVQYQDCQIEPYCPTESFPGFWEVPMVALYGGNTFPCGMIDACIPQPGTRNATLELLNNNFQKTYTGNRAPFGIFVTPSWLDMDDREQGYMDFLDYLGGLEDVYIVSIAKALEWIQYPVPLTEIKDFDAWKEKPVLPNNCARLVCPYENAETPTDSDEVLISCQPCPRCYPWLTDPLGTCTGA